MYMHVYIISVDSDFSVIGRDYMYIYMCIHVDPKSDDNAVFVYVKLFNSC